MAQWRLPFRRRDREEGAPPVPAEHEAEYESILVAFERGAFVPEIMATAVAMAAPRRRGIHVLVTIAVPSAMEIDEPMPAEEEAARTILEQARLIGGRRVTGHWTKIRAGQAGRVIVDEARALRARAVVLPLPPRHSGASLFGRTLETVLSERPCRVIIESWPRTG